MAFAFAKFAALVKSDIHNPSLRCCISDTISGASDDTKAGKAVPYSFERISLHSRQATNVCTSNQIASRKAIDRCNRAAILVNERGPFWILDTITICCASNSGGHRNSAEGFCDI